MLRRCSQTRVVLFLGADLVSTGVALVAAYLARFASGLFAVTERYIPSRYLEALPPAVLLCLATYAAVGAYRPPRGRAAPGPELRGTIGAVLSAALLLAAGALFYRDRYQFSRGVVFLFPVAAVPLLHAGRVLAWRMLTGLLRRGVGVSRCILVGEGPPAERLRDELEANPWHGVRIVARTASLDDLPGLLSEHRPDQVFVAFPADRPDLLRQATGCLGEEMADLRVVPDLPDLPHAGVDLLGTLPVITVQETPFFGLNRLRKRAFDLAAGGVLALLLLPLAVLVGLAVLLTSGRPVFYRQERMGLDGRRFSILKFRTMRVDAEAETGAVWARRGDPRCTRIGAWLRRFSLDELPQILNVLRGDMSLVGPRPERPVLIEDFRRLLPRYMLRHRIPAGLTGWAQVHGLRGESDLAERLRLDLDYLARWSLLLDVEVLLRTVWQVLVGRNAV